MRTNYDSIVIGAGHAGAEAALALARRGFSVLMLTINLDSVVMMACNPSLGGTAKAQLVREIDALGGEMGVNADKSLLQIRMLNMGKGPAVRSLRGQIDKNLYHRNMKSTIERHGNITLKQEEASEIISEGGKVKGVKTVIGAKYYADTVIACTGVYLNSRIIIGDYVKESGPSGMLSATKLTKSLIKLGLPVTRFKTGTPARVHKSSLDFDEMEIQKGDDDIGSFSFMTDEKTVNLLPCYLTYTTEETHRIIRENIHRSPLYNGCIKGIGPRYCPSIEDKVMRFADKDRHQIFIEPEGYGTLEMYVQGMSSSLPFDVQQEMYRSVPGMRRVKIMRYAYAIEYDLIDPTVLNLSLMVKGIDGLFMAGQLNGSSGYEEAAAQGLIAGINAGQYLKGEKPLILGRDQAYIGVLIDDLVTKGTNEPYRMMTARAEHRLILRQTNADLRLTETGYKIGLASEERYQRMLNRKEKINTILELLDKISPPKEYHSLFEEKGEPLKPVGISYRDILKRPSVSARDLTRFELFSDLDQDALGEAEITVKYEGYLKRQNKYLKEAMQLESKVLPEDIDYLSIDGLRIEARQKLDRIRPVTLGQAGRISGVSPADISVLIVHLMRKK
ncbi:MAG: tRNA uridine-5-carboxymethylaminomethyl(34) synthesis enzyme MnmG [Christensenellales bacterium]|jgi:tRNA uridine 5-carboxymethylaminomethyl modification enzyme